jgi:D-alanine-D-alanine ligase
MPVKNGANVWLSEFFALNNITFTGSNRETLKYDSDKVSAKNHLKSVGVMTANFFTAIPDQYKNKKDLPVNFPLFIKPTDAANGNGIDDQSLVNNFAEFKSKVSSLYSQYGVPALVEEYLGGREFTVSIIKGALGEMSVSAIEVVPPESKNGLRILGSVVKKSDSESLREIDEISIGKIKNLAFAAFQGLGVRGFARIDIKMKENGECYFMEANLIPGMNYGTSYFLRACEIDNGISYDDVVGLMIEECLERVRPAHLRANQKFLSKRADRNYFKKASVG